MSPCCTGSLCCMDAFATPGQRHLRQLDGTQRAAELLLDQLTAAICPNTTCVTPAGSASWGSLQGREARSRSISRSSRGPFLQQNRHSRFSCRRSTTCRCMMNAGFGEGSDSAATGNTSKGDEGKVRSEICPSYPQNPVVVLVPSNRRPTVGIFTLVTFWRNILRICFELGTARTHPCMILSLCM